MSALRGGDRFESAVDTLRSRPRRVWWTTFVLVALLSALWGIANPPFAAPDEPAHVLRAYALAHGDLTGDTPTREQVRRLDLTDRNDYLVVRAPELYARASRACFAGNGNATAACLRFGHSERLAEQGTYVARHPPGYYALVGPVTWFVPDGSAAIHVMRLIGAVLTGAFVATAITALRRTGASRIVAVGLAIAITPMVLFVSSVVNPSAPEIAAAIAVWVCGYLLVRSAAEGVDRRLVTAVGIAGCVLALSRQLGPLWLALIALTLLGVSNRDGLRNLARSVWARVWGASIVVASLVQVGWDVIVKPLDVTRSGHHHHVDMATTDVLRITFGRTFPRYREMIGWFGWLDTPAPTMTWVPWTILLGLLVVAVVLWSTRRQVAVLFGLLAAIVIVPAAIETPTYADAGTLTWQGRYTLPLAIGVPILAAGMLSTSERARQLVNSRLVWTIGIVLAVAQVVAFGQNLRRYTVGTDGPIAFWGSARWSPPLPRLFLIVAFAVVTIAFLWWLLVGTSREAETKA